ncbi:ribokinase [Humibacter albus]|uniref:ribokinase n=1 Tax=Humibacter albus TaxID=427754 RepID=UPI0003B4E38B|nr:ribokinase [Humibacter albus]
MNKFPDPSDHEGSTDGRVIIVGSINVDSILAVHQLPHAGETIHSTRRSTRFGGKGANQAVASARFAGRTTLISCVGTDHAGDDAVANLRANGVDTHAISRSNSPTGTAVVLVDDAGENEIVVSAGANADLDVSTVRLALADVNLRSEDIVAVGFEVRDEVVIAAIDAATRSGAHLVLNPSPVRAVPASIFGCRSTIILNEAEASCLASANTAPDAAAHLAAEFDSSVVLTLGSNGVLLRVHGEAVRVPSLKVEAIDTVGAGDTLFGTYCARLAAGSTSEQAAELAVTAAALAVTSPGAQDGMPTLSQVNSLLSESGPFTEHAPAAPRI